LKKAQASPSIHCQDNQRPFAVPWRTVLASSLQVILAKDPQAFVMAVMD